MGEVWYVPSKYAAINDPQAFFIQEWGLLTSGGDHTTNQIVRLSTRALLRELIEMVDAVKRGRVAKASLESILREIRWHIQENPLLRSCFGEDIGLFRQITDGSDSNPQWMSNMSLASSMLLKKMDRSPVIERCVNELKEQLAISETPFQYVRERRTH